MNKVLCFLLVSIWFSMPALSSDFFIFPVKEIEGTTLASGKSPRPLVDKRVLDLIKEDSQREIINHFVADLAKTYPQSIVGPNQVRDALVGKYQFIDNASLPCGSGFVAPLRRSYAIAIGITRASFYEVPREGDRVEVLIPITLNVQLIKPDLAKVVASASDTLYSPFIFSAEELKSEQIQKKISEVVLSGIKRQVSALIFEIGKSFNPKETVVKLLERSGSYFVVDKGFEVGFKTGDELVALKRGDSAEVIFKVVNSDAGFTVIRPLQGSPTVGEEYLFLFEGPADDSKKPKILPVVSTSPERAWSASVSDLLVKDLGFRSPFQVTPVDMNFRDTMESVSRWANCVPWEKFPASKTVFDSRLDHPQFLLRFDFSRSPVAEQKGAGGVKTLETFISGVTASIVDLEGAVVFSEVGLDNYRLERTAGQGISHLSAYEVSMKNATVDLSKKLLSQLKLEPTEFKINRVEQDRFFVDGLVLPPGIKKITYEVIRPLDITIGGRQVFVKIELGEGAEAPLNSGNDAVFYYSKLLDQPQRGDILRVSNLPNKDQTIISECTDTYRAPGSLSAEFKLPFVRHAAYKSQRHRVRLTDQSFYDDVNVLLKAGFFKHRVTPPELTDACVKSGYMLRVDSADCTSDLCKTQILSAITLIQEKSGTRIANAVQAEKIQLDGVPKEQLEKFVAYKGFESAAKNSRSLTEKFSINK